MCSPQCVARHSRTTSHSQQQSAQALPPLRLLRREPETCGQPLPASNRLNHKTSRLQARMRSQPLHHRRTHRALAQRNHTVAHGMGALTCMGTGADEAIAPSAVGDASSSRAGLHPAERARRAARAACRLSTGAPRRAPAKIASQ